MKLKEEEKVENPTSNQYETFFNLLCDVTKKYKSVELEIQDLSLGVEEMNKQLKSALEAK